MTLLYACNAIFAIVAESGRGLTKEEIFKINEQKYKARLDLNWGTAISIEIFSFICKKDDKYYLIPCFEYNPNWKKKGEKSWKNLEKIAG
jgi:hypothetical protein